MQRSTLAFLTSLGLLLLLGILLPYRLVGALAIAAALTLFVLWAGVKILQRLLWRVGRKLAFSYLLIGVLPIPMVVLLGGLSAYVLFGALLGHTFRDALVDVHAEFTDHLRPLMVKLRQGEEPSLERFESVQLAIYRKCKLVATNFDQAPEDWPSWITSPPGGRGYDETIPFLDAAEGPPRLAVILEEGEVQLLGLLDADLARILRERSGLWVEFSEREDESLELDLFGQKRVVLRGGIAADPKNRAEFFAESGSWWELWTQPILFWGEPLSHRFSLTGSEEPVNRLVAILNATPKAVYDRIVSTDAEVDTVAWGALLGIAFLLFDIYVIAAIMAIYMIVSLSWAVNRLSQATDRVQHGDFSTRIPVKRQDQLGQMQRSFNQMTASLEELVQTAAQKESLEKELQLARDLQQNLLPQGLTTTEAVEFASYFEPSAAIGGDYFDLFRLDDGRIAVVVADVSGHGLSAGLRMAMIKAALGMLIDQGLPAREILVRLNDMVRRERTVKGRPMVTATLAVFDPPSGRLEITNAGHTPTYLVRGDTVEEILLPSPPLGTLGTNYAEASVELQPGDRAAWLSDGLIEALDSEDRSFGYERVTVSLASAAGGSATDLRDRLLADLAAFIGGRVASDDRTLVVMRYLPGPVSPLAEGEESPTSD